MTLNRILKKAFPNCDFTQTSLIPSPLLEALVTSITSDSREVRPGSIFVSIQGSQVHGNQFLKDALSRGAILVVGEEDPASFLHDLGTIPYLVHKDARLALAELSAAFYDHPSTSMLMVGVTGTSGKTTTTYLVEAILKSAGMKVGVIGTVNFRYGEKVIPSTHTTPAPVELQRLLSEMKNAGCNAVVMEVSSHALKQKRVACVAFDGMIFTNLSQDHLDFHPDMEDYFQSKAILFKDLAIWALQNGKKPKGVIQEDDPYGARLIQELRSLPPPAIEVLPISTQKETLRSSLAGISGKAYGIPIRSMLTGQFNCSNILASIRLTQALGIDPQSISYGIGSLTGIPGRLESVANSKGIHVWVDYAHKPDALQKVLQTLQKMKVQAMASSEGSPQLITVFGCGGDRDRAKRPLMGKIAVDHSDWVFVTSDNPRTEDPLDIIEEILIEIKGQPKVKVEPDRKKAIFAAIQKAKRGDLVLIAGKGHEDYQIFGKTKVHFDDREIAKEAFFNHKA